MKHIKVVEIVWWCEANGQGKQIFTWVSSEISGNSENMRREKFSMVCKKRKNFINRKTMSDVIKPNIDMNNMKCSNCTVWNKINNRQEQGDLLSSQNWIHFFSRRFSNLTLLIKYWTTGKMEIEKMTKYPLMIDAFSSNTFLFLRVKKLIHNFLFIILKYSLHICICKWINLEFQEVWLAQGQRRCLLSKKLRGSSFSLP